MKGATVTKLPKKPRGLLVANVTEHALLRWLERVEGIDLTPIKEAMAREGLDTHYDRLVVEYIEENSEFRFDDIRRKILQIVSIPAMCGAISVRHEQVVLRLVAGAVVTVTPYRSSLPDTSRRKRAHEMRRPRRWSKKTQWERDDED